MGKFEGAGLKVLFEEDYKYKGRSFVITACLDKNNFTTIAIYKNKKPVHYINIDGWRLSNKGILGMAKVCIRDLVND